MQPPTSQYPGTGMNDVSALAREGIMFALGLRTRTVSPDDTESRVAKPRPEAAVARGHLDLDATLDDVIARYRATLDYLAR